MSKGMGVLLILWASMLLRQRLLLRRKEELETLASLLHSFRRLWQQIYATLLPLPELLRREGYDGAGGEFFAAVMAAYDEKREEGFSAHWRSAAKKLPLSAEMLGDIAGLCDSFGASETELERAFAALIRRLEEELSFRRELYGKQGRLVSALCLSGGLILSLIAL